VAAGAGPFLVLIYAWRAAMVATIAHNVRSSLTTVQMALEELREEPGDRTRRPDRHRPAADHPHHPARQRPARPRPDRDPRRTRLDLRPVRVDDLIHEAVTHLGSADVKIEVDP
jgi:hypothetical protein